MCLFTVLPKIRDDTLHFAELSEQHLNIFFSQRFNLIKNLSKCLGKEIVRSLAEISSLMYNRVLPLLTFLSNVIGEAT